MHKVLSVPNTEVVSCGFVTDRVDLQPETIGRINEEFDAFVIPLANAFRPSFSDKLRRLTRLIRQLQMPVVVVGVGAQARPCSRATGIVAGDSEGLPVRGAGQVGQGRRAR